MLQLLLGLHEPTIGSKSNCIHPVFMTSPAVSRNSDLAGLLGRLRQARPIVLPSMLLCDFGNLQREIERLEEAGVEALHMDVMDGMFVPNMTYGMPIIEACRRLTKMPIDVHLMIKEPKRYAQAFVDAGSDLITFHIEAEADPVPLLESIRAQGVAAGLAINPSTPMEKLLPFVSHCDLALVMSVEAGFGGQAFNPLAIARLKQLRERLGADFLLEVDGGINEKTANLVKQAGADLLVVGSAIFRREDYCQAMTQLHQAMQ
jgi:ribulose-phosphate 3-epimerase